MQNVQVINATSADISILGLGSVPAGETKSGFIPQIVFEPDQDSYMAFAARVGIGITDLSGLSPFTQTGREDFTAANSVASATRFVTATAASVDYALALPAASTVASGVVVRFFFLSGAFTVSLTPNGADTVGGGDVYDLTKTPADSTGTGFVITLTNTITRNDGGSWVTEGYVSGGRIVIQDAEDVANNGTFVVNTVSATVLTVVGTGLTNNADDTTIHFGVDNRPLLALATNVVRLQSDGVSNWTSV